MKKSNDNMEKSIKQKVTAFFQKEQSQKEVNSFWRFFLQPEESDAKEEAMLDVWDRIEDCQPGMEQEARKAYSVFESRTGGKKRTFRTLYVVPLLKYAAILISPVLLFLAVWEYVATDKEPEMVSLSTSNASTRSDILPDGTAVVLNAGTTLEYPAEFVGDTREVILSGEANFKVAADKKKPFIVKTAQLSVTALGTKFNVRAYDSRKIITTLEEGSIRIATGKKVLLVKPDEQVTYTSSDGKFETKKVDVSDATAWLSGNIVFEDAPLPEILAEIERYHNIRITVKGKLDEKTLYSIKYKKSETLEQMLEVLCYMTGNTSYRMENQKHVVIVSKLQ